MAPKPDEWMPLKIRKYLGDTTHLTRDQHGAYLLLLMAYWMRGAPLPDDDGQLAAICKATKPEWKRLRPLMAEFFTVSDGVWSQKCAEEELATAKALVTAKSEAGKAGAAVRWQKNASANGSGMADASNSHKLRDAPLPKPRTIESKTVDLRNFVVGRGGEKETMSDQNKIALFQKWLATSIGQNGWQIVGTAADPAADGYEDAVAFCRAHAKKNGKGWPHKWPSPQVAAE